MLIEAFNVTNHVNLPPPVGGMPGSGNAMSAAAFLARTAARRARQVQWGLRFVF